MTRMVSSEDVLSVVRRKQAYAAATAHQLWREARIRVKNAKAARADGRPMAVQSLLMAARELRAQAKAVQYEADALARAVITLESDYLADARRYRALKQMALDGKKYHHEHQTVVLSAGLTYEVALHAIDQEVSRLEVKLGRERAEPVRVAVGPIATLTAPRLSPAERRQLQNRVIHRQASDAFDGLLDEKARRLGII